MKKISFPELFPENPSIPQRLYCVTCEGYLALTFTDYLSEISGIVLDVEGLPQLKCDKCDKLFLPDSSRFALIELWSRAEKAGLKRLKSKRRKPLERFNYTAVEFDYDSDDYHCIPGLYRDISPGFLTPVFFHKRVLVKFDQLEDYNLKFCSRTYGSIWTNSFSISFGINPNNRVVMWLGDIGELPESEQHYLRSENIPSDHLIGSEFYDGQIECKFTDPTLEDSVIKLRSDFLEAFRRVFGTRASHLDQETLEAIDQLAAPVDFGSKNFARVADLLNRVHVESLDSNSLGKIIEASGISAKGLGGLKRLQIALESYIPGVDVKSLLCPFYVAYDLRVANSHLQSETRRNEISKSVCERLLLQDHASSEAIYSNLLSNLQACYTQLTNALNDTSPFTPTPPTASPDPR